MGKGRLEDHLKRLVGLDLQDCVEIVSEAIGIEMKNLDLLLYLPIRNDHFIPVLLAGAAGVPALSNDLPGVEDIIEDGRTGYLLPTYEISPWPSWCCALAMIPCCEGILATALACR